MKEKIINQTKKVVIPVFISILCGGICGKIVYNIYDENDTFLTNSTMYLLQAGAYSSYDNMRANTMGNNYVYYEDDGLYKAIIGITSSYDNIEKIKNAYNGEVIVNEYYLNDIELSNKISKLDKELSKEEDSNNIKEIINSMLALYKEENINLTKGSNEKLN